MKTNDGLWKLSPSGLYDYDACKTCFWIENHIGKTFPLLRLNDAMDEKLKHRFDYFRRNNSTPPEVVKNLPNVKLFTNLSQLNIWRNKYTPLEFVNRIDGYILKGKIDDLLVSSDNKLIPIDFKSSGDPPKDEKKKYYISQLNAYGLMFENNNYKVAKTGYILYYYTNNRTDPNVMMNFNVHFFDIDIDLTQFRIKLKDTVVFLNGPMPQFNLNCGQCKINSNLVQKFENKSW